MFGFVNASLDELQPESKERYMAVYCGICRDIRDSISQTARLTLSYDMVFLAVLLESLYEPCQKDGRNPCVLHPCNSRTWSQSEFTKYAAQMNVALAYYKCWDDWNDERKLSSLAMLQILKPSLGEINRQYPRQCQAIQNCLQELNALEKDNCANPDLPAGCFGKLMEELMVYTSDMWEPYLRQIGNGLGRFIYLCDAAMDYEEDEKKGNYNPFLAMGTGKNYSKWDEYLMLTISACTESFEILPLVQDKEILNNILYSGIWLKYKQKQKQDNKENSDERSL